MKLIADALIALPFKLDFCARGPDVDPLTCHLAGWDATLYFPPSLSDETDGQGLFGDWAWWTGKTLRLVLEHGFAESDDLETLRAAALDAGNEILRRFLNAYRWRFRRPEVHPVRLDARTLALEREHSDGRREALSEPVDAFFYQRLPVEPPRETSVSETTLPALQADVQDGHEPPLADQLRLDAELLEQQGEAERAAALRRLIDS